ncbi:Uncharacterised protein [Mycobacteroides abscessus subsp. bolletii]|nr:Uncharacterised protein [Mycobacteroides abscessus subsp. bolletii]
MIEFLLVSTGAEADVPWGRTIGMDAAFLSASLPAWAPGGQSTSVGGQLSALSPPVPAAGGAHPADAPKSPGPQMSAWAIGAGAASRQRLSTDAATQRRVARCPRAYHDEEIADAGRNRG